MQQRTYRYLLPILVACTLFLSTQGAVQAHAPRPSTQTDWPMFGFDTTHSHFNPYETVLSTSNVGSLALQWQTAINGPNNFSSPVVAGDMLYVGTYTTRTLYAISLSTHVIVWKRYLHAAVSSPVVANGIVYVGAERLYALNAMSGAIIWQTGAYKRVSTPTLAGNRLYASLNGTKFCAFTLAGQLRWCDRSFVASGTAAVVGSVVYVPSFENTLYALNATSGATLWTYTASNSLYDSPSVINGIVYFSAYDGTFYALNATTGTFLWGYTAPAGMQSSPAVASGIVYIGSNDPANTLYAFNATTGAVLWSYTSANESFFASPVVANGVVYIGSADDVNNGSLYAFDARSGALLLQFHVGSEIGEDAVVVNGMVYVVGEYPTDAVYAFGLPG